MSSDVTSDIPPTPPKASGRKKIKIQRIEDSRNRQVRLQGLLLCGRSCGVTASLTLHWNVSVSLNFPVGDVSKT